MMAGQMVVRTEGSMRRHALVMNCKYMNSLEWFTRFRSSLVLCSEASQE